MKMPGPYVPLDVNYARDADIRRAGEAAELLFLRSLAYCKAHRTDGFVAEFDLEVVGVGLKNVAKRAERLVEVGLWEVTDGGWNLRSWHRWNETSEEMAAKRERARARQQAKRDRERSEKDSGRAAVTPMSQRDAPVTSALSHVRHSDVTPPNRSKDKTETTEVQPSAATNESRLTVTQRSKRITDAYAQAEPMCRWPAVNGVVIKAIKAGRYTDEEIAAALLRLADEGRSVTVETLRVELDGLTPRASPAGQPPSRNAQILSAAMQRARAAEGAT